MKRVLLLSAMLCCCASLFADLIIPTYPDAEEDFKRRFLTVVESGNSEAVLELLEKGAVPYVFYVYPDGESVYTKVMKLNNPACVEKISALVQGTVQAEEEQRLLEIRLGSPLELAVELRYGCETLDVPVYAAGTEVAAADTNAALNKDEYPAGGYITFSCRSRLSHDVFATEDYVLAGQEKGMLYLVNFKRKYNEYQIRENTSILGYTEIELVFHKGDKSFSVKAEGLPDPQRFVFENGKYRCFFTADFKTGTLEPAYR